MQYPLITFGGGGGGRSSGMYLLVIVIFTYLTYGTYLSR